MVHRNSLSWKIVGDPSSIGGQESPSGDLQRAFRPAEEEARLSLSYYCPVTVVFQRNMVLGLPESSVVQFFVRDLRRTNHVYTMIAEIALLSSLLSLPIPGGRPIHFTSSRNS